MYSFSLDYIFNRVYDGLLWLKYIWYFWIKRLSPEDYLLNVQGEEWDGLRDRGWLATSTSETGGSGLGVLDNFGINTTRDTDGDGIPDVRDSKTFDSNNLTTEKIRELFGDQLSWTDHVRMFFGMDPRDFDGDGIPDSVELEKGMDANNPDTDHDGVLDGDEIFKGLDPLNKDTDSDGVIDGRDAYPADSYRSVAYDDMDTDGDGIGDKYEKLIGSDINSVDTDNDGIMDNYDFYPNDANNTSNVTDTLQAVVSNSTSGFTLSIQNSFLSFLSDVLTILSLFMLPLFIFIFYLWLMRMRAAVEHYEHMFHGAIGYDDVYGKHAKHDTDDNHHDTKPEVIHAHNPKVIAHEVEPPKESEYVKHPRWAMVEDYMSSDHDALWRIGILEADNLLHDVMRTAGYPGQDLGEMLKEANFRAIDLAWDAHKIRNKIAHEGMQYTLTEREARRAFAMYEAVFKELKVI